MTPPRSTTPTTAPASTPTAPLEASNPAGPPEGTEPGQAGTQEGHATPLAPGDTEPSAADVQPNLDTSTDDAALPAPAPLDALAAYLAQAHPTAALPGEHPATTAVRLLTRMGATGTPALARCPEAYCNLPEHHLGLHGWVNQS